MPRCCSSRIQSEVAWRAALRPLTVPAIWIAPPNSNSFSVSVVLPASGCEMIANVRRRSISAVRSAMRLSLSGRAARRAEHAPQHGRVFAAADRLIVAAAHADLFETARQVQPDRAGVGWTHFEECLGHAGGGGALEQRVEQPPADAATAELGADAQVEDVGLAGTEAHDAVGHHLAIRGHHPADVADPQTVAENALAPGKLISGALDRNHLGDVAHPHRSDQ